MSDVASESSEPFGELTPIPPTLSRTLVQSQLVRGVMEAAVLAAAAEEDVYGYGSRAAFVRQDWPRSPTPPSIRPCGVCNGEVCSRPT